jgi:hypothetical protein
MPPLASELVDLDAVTKVRAWIDTLPVAPPSGGATTDSMGGAPVDAAGGAPASGVGGAAP